MTAPAAPDRLRCNGTVRINGCTTVEIHDKSVTLTISGITEDMVRRIARKLALPEVK